MDLPLRLYRLETEEGLADSETGLVKPRGRTFDPPKKVLVGTVKWYLWLLQGILEATSILTVFLAPRLSD